MQTARTSNSTNYLMNKCENLWGRSLCNEVQVWTCGKSEHVQDAGTLYFLGTPYGQNDWRTDTTKNITFATPLPGGK